MAIFGLLFLFHFHFLSIAAFNPCSPYSYQPYRYPSLRMPLPTPSTHQDRRNAHSRCHTRKVSFSRSGRGLGRRQPRDRTPAGIGKSLKIRSPIVSAGRQFLQLVISLNAADSNTKEIGSPCWKASKSALHHRLPLQRSILPCRSLFQTYMHKVLSQPTLLYNRCPLVAPI
jgi:hypothetical protein